MGRRKKNAKADEIDFNKIKVFKNGRKTLDSLENRTYSGEKKYRRYTARIRRDAYNALEVFARVEKRTISLIMNDLVVAYVLYNKDKIKKHIKKNSLIFYNKEKELLAEYEQRLKDYEDMLQRRRDNIDNDDEDNNWF